MAAFLFSVAPLVDFPRFFVASLILDLLPLEVFLLCFALDALLWRKNSETCLPSLAKIKNDNPEKES